MFSRDFLELLRDPDNLSAMSLKYRQAKPFPNIVLDWVFNSNALQAVLDHFPKPDESWWKYDNVLERKFAKDDLSSEHFTIQEIIAKLNSRQFTDFLQTLTGIQGLIVDQTLRGGGLHCSARGGKLDLHIDHNVHPVTGLHRRVNVILYLNPHWEEEWNGALELWEDLNGKPRRCLNLVQPKLGKLVVFNTSEVSWHGHPDPLLCPEGETRKSIALYYWTAQAPEKVADPHSTVYAGRPGDMRDPEVDALRAQRAKGRLTG